MKKVVLIFVLAVLSCSFIQGQNQKFLKPINGLEKMIIDATTGKEKASDKDAFTFDQNFKNWGLDQNAPATEATSLAVFSLSGEASFDEIFKTGADKEKIAITIPQIRKVIAKYGGILKDGSIFFLVKAGDKFYAVHVATGASGIGLETWQSEDYLSFSARDKFIALIK